MKRKVFDAIIIIYVVITLYLWSVFVSFYLYRFFYYKGIQDAGLIYTVNANNSDLLKDVLINKVSGSDEGLVKLADNSYLYKGQVNDNYLFYSGLLWRITKINKDGSIRLISQDVLYSEVYNSEVDNSLFNSRIYKYIDENVDNQSSILKLLNNKDKYLTYGNYCLDSYPYSDGCIIKNYLNYVGLPTIDEYNMAKGYQSFLNNGLSFWTVNTSSNSTDESYYINAQGVVTKMKLKGYEEISIGIKPVITLKTNLKLIKGTGLKNIPYVIEDESYYTLKEAPKGSYVSYSNQLWRISDNSDNIKLIANNVISENGAIIKKPFNSIYYNRSDVFYYLKEYVNTLDNSYLVDGRFYTGQYNENSDYYVSKSTSVNSSIGLVSIDDYLAFSVEDINEDTWTSSVSSSYTSMMNTITKTGGIGLGYIDKELAIRCAIYISDQVIIKGSGTINDPYIIKEQYED